MQYSRLLWEFEGSELALDIDINAIRPDSDGRMPKLNERLFRKLDLGEENTYNIFSPVIRDASQINGLNEMLIRIEDVCGLSRGTFSNLQTQAKTATELKILRQRSYATVADTQKSLQQALEHLIYAMDVWATIGNLAPSGDYNVSFEFDDSIVTDIDTEFDRRVKLLQMGIIKPEELQKWYFGEVR